jgi:hypothetical protein
LSIHQPTPALPVEMEHSIEDVRFIAQHMRNKDRFDSVSIFPSFRITDSLSFTFNRITLFTSYI